MDDVSAYIIMYAYMYVYVFIYYLHYMMERWSFWWASKGVE